jgi:hypothetical protein
MAANNDPRQNGRNTNEFDSQLEKLQQARNQEFLGVKRT